MAATALNPKPSSNSQPNEPLQLVKSSFNGSTKYAAIIRCLGLLTTCYSTKELTGPGMSVYVEIFEPLTEEMLIRMFSRAMRESDHFPSPSQLLSLAGVETLDQTSEREAREGLDWMLRTIRKHGVIGKAINGRLIREEWWEGALPGIFHPAEYEKIPPPAIPEAVSRTLELLGAGSAEVGCRLLGEHPLLSKNPEDSLSISLKLAAIEKIEARWIAIWRKVNK